MKRFGFFILISLLLLGLVWFLAYWFYFSKHIVLRAGEERSGNIVMEEGTVLLEEGATLKGNIQLQKGLLILKDKAQVLGSVQVGWGEIKTSQKVQMSGGLSLQKGTIQLGENNTLHGSIVGKEAKVILAKGTELGADITLKDGLLRLEEGVQVKGDVKVGKGTMEKHSSAVIQGSKPWAYSTYNWPKALRYFDSLPEDHKEALGLVFLTKESNTLIREPEIVAPEQYFEGVYDYREGELVPVDLADEALTEVYFKKAKDFFGSLPERRLGVFGVGAATKIYAHDPNFADIYLPADGSQTLMIHEMGHVLDFKGDFTDFHTPRYPWTAENAVSGYGSTHPGEDFAEAYRLYVLYPDRFMALIQEMPERKVKWDFLKSYVFVSG